MATEVSYIIQINAQTQTSLKLSFVFQLRYENPLPQ